MAQLAANVDSEWVNTRRIKVECIHWSLDGEGACIVWVAAGPKHTRKKSEIQQKIPKSTHHIIFCIYFAGSPPLDRFLEGECAGVHLRKGTLFNEI